MDVEARSSLRANLVTPQPRKRLRKRTTRRSPKIKPRVYAVEDSDVEEVHSSSSDGSDDSTECESSNGRRRQKKRKIALPSPLAMNLSSDSSSNSSLSSQPSSGSVSPSHLTFDPEIVDLSSHSDEELFEPPTFDFPSPTTSAISVLSPPSSPILPSPPSSPILAQFDLPINRSSRSRAPRSSPSSSSASTSRRNNKKTSSHHRTNSRQNTSSSSSSVMLGNARSARREGRSRNVSVSVSITAGQRERERSVRRNRSISIGTSPGAEIVFRSPARTARRNKLNRQRNRTPFGDSSSSSSSRAVSSSRAIDLRDLEGSEGSDADVETSADSSSHSNSNANSDDVLVSPETRRQIILIDERTSSLEDDEALARSLQQVEEDELQISLREIEESEELSRIITSATRYQPPLRAGRAGRPAFMPGFAERPRHHRPGHHIPLGFYSYPVRNFAQNMSRLNNAMGDFTSEDYDMLLALDSPVKKGISDATINSLPTNKLKEGENQGQCCICLEDMISGEDVKRLPCMHPFHVICINTWLKENGCCPIDKKKVCG